MKISARNRLKGKITDVKKGATTAHVRIDVGGTTVTASITNEAVDELGLKVGQEAFAIIQGVRRDGGCRRLGASMVRLNEIRHGELAVTYLPPATDASLIFIGRIHTPWTNRLVCPRQGRLDGPVCRIDIFEPWVPALNCITEFDRLEVLYWLHESR